MPHPKFLTPSTLLLVAFAHSTAVGQTISSPYTFIEHGQAWAVFAGRSDLNPGQLGLGPRDATSVGGRYAVAFGAMNLDVDGTLFMSNRTVLDVSRPEEDRSLGKADINIALLDARLRLNLTGARAWRGLQPFLLFGGGLATGVSAQRFLEQASVMPEDEWYHFGTRFVGTFGAGTAYHLSSKISLRLDGIVNLWKISTPVGWLTVENDPNGENIEGEWVSAKSVRIGAAWRF